MATMILEALLLALEALSLLGHQPALLLEDKNTNHYCYHYYYYYN